MSTTRFARLFKNGRSQAVRLPKEFRFDGDKVRVTRVGKGVLLEPAGGEVDVEEWLAQLNSLNDDVFMPDGREQPPMPPDLKGFD